MIIPVNNITNQAGWLKNRLLMAAVPGAVSRPAGCCAGHKPGGVAFTDTGIAMLTLAIGRELLMPLLMLLSTLYKGLASGHEPPRTTGVSVHV